MLLLCSHQQLLYPYAILFVQNIISTSSPWMLRATKDKTGMNLFNTDMFKTKDSIHYLSRNTKPICYISYKFLRILKFQAMDWIQLVGTHKKMSSNTSLILGLNALALESEANNRTYATFNRQTFRSHYLPQTFKAYYYTDITSQNAFGPSDKKDLITEFMLILPTQYENLSVILTVSLDLGAEYIKYTSYPTKHSQNLNFTNEQVIALGRYFSLYLNSRLTVGWISIDPESGCIIHQHANNSLGFLQRRVQRVPEELTNHLLLQVKDIEKNWRSILPSIFALLSLPQKKMINHPYWKTHRDRRSPQDSEEFTLLSQYIKHSFIQYPQMFDQTCQQQPEKRIRSRYLTREEKGKKFLAFKSQTDCFNSFFHKFNRDIVSTLQLFIPQSVVASENQSLRRQIPSNILKELSDLLLVARYESRTPIYSKIQISKVVNTFPLAKSNFSELKILEVEGKKIEDPKPNPQYIVSKHTENNRFINQSEILKFIGPGRCLFITRFFFNQQEPRNLFCQYCQLKSIDSYISINKKILSLETKIMFIHRIAYGIRFLRDYGIVHNDLKPQNVLLKIVGDKARNRGTFLPRLIDFGQSHSKYQRQPGRNRYRRGFTVPYAPPQQVKYDKHSEKTDIYSLGVMMLEYMFGVFPTQAVRKGKEMYHYSQDLYLRLFAIAPQKIRDFSCPKIMQLLYQFALRCIHPNIEYRPSIDWIIIILRQFLIIIDRYSSP